MFIYHFNRMIRNRILWIVFAVVIAVAFLSMDSCYRTPGGGEAQRPQNEAGTIGGESVSYDEYDFARRVVANSVANLGPAATETQIWAHIAAMRTAQELGLTATRRELADRILSTPDFQIGGAFSRDRYEQVVSSIGLSVPTFERMQSQYIVLYKLMSVVTAGATASPMAVEDEFAQYTDTFSLRYATVADTHGSDDVEVTEDDMRDYYARNTKAYELPDRVQVRYIALPATNFLDSVDMGDLEADIQDIYDSDPSRYTRNGTNGVEQLTLEEARDGIAEELKLAEAVHIATTNLADFAESLAAADPEKFAEEARARGFEPGDTPLFGYDRGYIPGIEPAALEEFRHEAADLDADRPDALFAIARGKRNVYLMRILTNDVAHVQSYEEVADTIRPLVVSEKRIGLFDADSRKALEGLKAAMKDGGDFATACEGLSLPVSTNIQFKASEAGPNSFDNASAIIPAALRMKAGDISDPVKVRGGAVIISVDGRTHDDGAENRFELETTRGQIAEQRAQANNATFFAEWLVWNLRQKGFTSRLLESLDYGGGIQDEEDEE